MSAAPQSTLIRQASIVSEDGISAPRDVFVEGGKITAVEPNLAADAERTIDAQGKLLLPGGIDPHVHFLTPSDGTITCDTFESGSTAAAFGGTTTALQFCVQDRGEPLTGTVIRWRRMLEDSASYTDIGFHLMITDLDAPERLDELAELPGMGVTSFKVFLSGENAITGGRLFRVMQIAQRVGARVMVHAEDGDSIDVLTEQALAAGRRDPIEHARTRPSSTEAIAVYRTIEYARMTGAAVYFVHLSSAAAVAHVRRAREEGLPIDGETCPQYFVFDESILEGPFEEAAVYLFTPPPRGSRDRDEIWRALADGALSTVASDHGGYCRHEKTGAQDFARVPQGIIGIETRLEFLHQYGVRTGRLTLPRLVELTATRPAELFGLAGRKGRVAVGLDADLVLFDPAVSHTVSRETHHSAHDHNPYEGTIVDGSVTHTMVRGSLVVEDRALTTTAPSGALVARAGI